MNRVRVRISLTEKVSYSQIVEMDRKDFEALSEELNIRDFLVGERISSYLDLMAISNSQIDPDDVDEFEIVEELA